MITIEGISDKYILDLNTSTSGHRELSVDSSSNGSKLTWVVSYVSSDLIDAYPFSTNMLSIDVDLKYLKKEEFIILRNIKKEKIGIVVKPNTEATRDKNYIFKLGKNTVSGNIISINIVSKENGKTEPWEIVRNGLPLSYGISTTKTKITIELSTILSDEAVSNFELIQTNSGKMINFKLRHIDSNSVELIKEAD
jgi:hypothetical protein